MKRKAYCMIINLICEKCGNVTTIHVDMAKYGKQLVGEELEKVTGKTYAQLKSESGRKNKNE